jgi:hypothetical protein
VRGSYGGPVGVGNDAIFPIWIKIEKLDSAIVRRGAETLMLQRTLKVMPARNLREMSQGRLNP